MAKTKLWSVAIPISGVMHVDIEADSAEEAISKALAGDYDLDDVDEWEPHRHLIRGNVFYGALAEADAEEVS